MRPAQKEQRFWECIRECDALFAKRNWAKFEARDSFWRSFELAMAWYRDLLKIEAENIRTIIEWLP